MAFELRQGDECIVSADFLFKGEQAFTRGDVVTIEGITPDQLQPGNKYVVHSDALSRAVRLPGALLKRISCPRCKKRLAEARPGNHRTCECGWSDKENLHPDRPAIEIKPHRVANGSNGASADGNERARIAYVLKNIMIQGLVAFREGDYVKVEGENPDPERPDYKYLVTSPVLKERFLLSDADIRF